MKGYIERASIAHCGLKLSDECADGLRINNTRNSERFLRANGWSRTAPNSWACPACVSVIRAVKKIKT